MNDNIDPIPGLVVLTLLVAVWLALGIQQRRIQQRRADEAISRHHSYRARGLCAAVWTDDGDPEWHVCSLRYEHVGPHLDGHTGSVRRRLLQPIPRPA